MTFTVPATGQLVWTVEHGGGVNSVAFSPDGKYLVSGATDLSARLWHVANGQEVQSFEDTGVRGSSVIAAFSPDGKYLASADIKVRLWDFFGNGQLLRRFETGGWVRSVAFSPDGKYLASGSDGNTDNTVRLWDVATGQEVRRFEPTGRTNTVNSVAFSPDGTILASGSDGNTVRLWDVATGQEVRRFEVANEYEGSRLRNIRVISVAFSPDGTILASGSRVEQNAAIHLWDVAATNTASEISPDPEFPTFTHYPNPAESSITVEYRNLPPKFPDSGCLTSKLFTVGDKTFYS